MMEIIYGFCSTLDVERKADSDFSMAVLAAGLPKIINFADKWQVVNAKEKNIFCTKASMAAHSLPHCQTRNKNDLHITHKGCFGIFEAPRKK